MDAFTTSVDKTLILNNSAYHESERTEVYFQQWIDIREQMFEAQSVVLRKNSGRKQNENH